MSESDADFEMLEKRLGALTPDESIRVRRPGWVGWAGPTDPYMLARAAGQVFDSGRSHA